MNWNKFHEQWREVASLPHFRADEWRVCLHPATAVDVRVKETIDWQITDSSMFLRGIPVVEDMGIPIGEVDIRAAARQEIHFMPDLDLATSPFAEMFTETHEWHNACFVARYGRGDEWIAAMIKGFANLGKSHIVLLVSEPFSRQSGWTRDESYEWAEVFKREIKCGMWASAPVEFVKRQIIRREQLANSGDVAGEG